MTQVSTQSNPWDLAPIIGKSDRSWQDDRDARDSRPWDFAPIIESSPSPTIDSPAWQDSPEQQPAPARVTRVPGNIIDYPPAPASNVSTREHLREDYTFDNRGNLVIGEQPLSPKSDDSRYRRAMGDQAGTLGRMGALVTSGVDTAVREAGATWQNIRTEGLGSTLSAPFLGGTLPATAENFTGIMDDQTRAANEARSEGATAAERFASGIAAMPATFLDPKTIAAMMISHSPSSAMGRAVFTEAAEKAIASRIGPAGLEAVRAVGQSTIGGAGFGAAAAGVQNQNVVEGAAQGAIAGLPFAVPGMLKAGRGLSAKEVVRPAAEGGHAPELPAVENVSPRLATESQPVAQPNGLGGNQLEQPAPPIDPSVAEAARQAEGLARRDAMWEAHAPVRAELPFNTAIDRLKDLPSEKRLNRPEVDAVLEGTGYRSQNQGWPTVDELRGNIENMRARAAAESSKPTEAPATPATIPESPATLDAQMQAMRDGKRPAVLVTEGAAMPDKGEFAKLKTDAGTFIYDPKRIKPTEIKAAVAEDRVGDILGLGTPRKPAPEDATGVVVVRTTDGTEKQAVVASEATMPAVTEAAQKMAGPGDTVGLEQPGKVIAERMEAKAASKPQVSRTEEPTAPESAPVQRGVPEEREPTQTSARKEWLDTDRSAMLGTDTVDSPQRRGWKEALETAQKQGLHEGPKAMALAAEVNAKPRSLNDIQTAGLVQHAAELKVAHRDLMKQIEGSKDAGELAELAAKATHIEGAFDTLTTALKRSGTEKGRALASQKLTLDADLSLVAVKARAKAAKGESLSPAEHKAFEELTQRFEKIEAELKEARAKLDESIADQAVRRHKGDTRHRGKTKVDYRQTVDEVRALLKAGCL